MNFKRINQTQSEIYQEGNLRGLVELIGDFYRIEVDYQYELTIPKKQKHLIKGLVERIVKRVDSRNYRELVKRHKLRKSIINKAKILD